MTRKGTQPQKRRRSRPAPPEYRASVKWKSIKAPQDLCDSEWFKCNVPWIRMAAILIGRNRAELTEAVRNAAASGVMPVQLDSMIKTRDHLISVAKMIDVVVTREFLALESLGYSPKKNPPPDDRNGKVTALSAYRNPQAQP